LEGTKDITLKGWTIDGEPFRNRNECGSRITQIFSESLRKDEKIGSRIERKFENPP
jgi:hypothetical protein